MAGGVEQSGFQFGKLELIISELNQGSTNIE